MANNINIFFFFLFFFFFFSVSSAASDDIITAACKASRDPKTCKKLLSGHVPPSATTPAEVIQSALNVSTETLNSGEGMIHEVQRDSIGNLNWTNAVSSCLESIQYSKYRLKRTSLVLKQRKNRLKDARAWLSAALAYQYNCWSGLRYTGANTTTSGAKATEFFNATLIPITSSALGMLFNYDAVDPTSFEKWAPARTERDGFWETLPTGGASRPPGWTGEVPKGLNANVIVCKTGGCAYDTVQGAVDSAPANLRRHVKARYVIRIEAGVYEEKVRVPLNKTNIVLLGDGVGKTVITGSDSVGLEKGMTTYNSAVVGVAGDGFMAANLTIQNTAPAGANQAVAFRSDSDHSVLEGCEFIGNQDTLNAVSLRQLYKCCVIQGNVDFIFGNSAAVFEDCTILVAPRMINPEKGEKNSVTAHGRTDPAQSTGFVFRNSVVNGTKDYMDSYYNNTKVHLNYLGRPWKEFSRTVFIECTLEALISPEGWLEWQGEFALKTLYYGEFGNTGPGSNTSKRVNWSSLIPAEHVESFSPQNFIQLY